MCNPLKCKLLQINHPVGKREILPVSRPAWAGLALGLALIVVGCSGAMESDSPAMPGPESSRAQSPGGEAPEAMGPVPGIYFLHDISLSDPPQSREGCAYLGEAVAGEAGIGKLAGGGGGEGAVLDLAAHARSLGGNVVALPHFSVEFPGGILTGRMYRCDAGNRRRLHAQGVAQQQLTVVQ